jgi:hypothetical protein
MEKKIKIKFIRSSRISDQGAANIGLGLSKLLNLKILDLNF